MAMASLSVARQAGAHSRNQSVHTRADVPGTQTPLNTTPVPFSLLIVVAVLVATGLATVYVAVLSDSDYSFSRQVMGVGLGVVVMILFWVFDYRNFDKMVVPLLVLDVVLILLPMVPGLGVEINGATSWVKIGSFTFQPSELAKPVTIVMVAAACSKYGGKITRGKDYFKMLALVLVPFLLLVTEDLGTALVIFIFGFFILWVAGSSHKWLLLTLGVIIALVAAVLGLNGVVSAWTGGNVQLIEDYQMSRLMVFLDQDNEEYADDAYNLNQAKIAVGSGEISGKGFGNATQSSGGFLPEPATDFIFCVFAEQYGFIGCFVLLALYLALFASALNVGLKSSDLLGLLITVGVMGMWLFQIVENIGMDLGLMPITGIPLPFMSYGSSFMLTNFICVGLLCSIWARREGVRSKSKKKQGKAGQLNVKDAR